MDLNGYDELWLGKPLDFTAHQRRKINGLKKGAKGIANVVPKIEPNTFWVYQIPRTIVFSTIYKTTSTFQSGCQFFTLSDGELDTL